MTKKLIYTFLAITLLFSCEEKVESFDGFMQQELEYMLAGSGAKVWEQIPGDAEVTDDCLLENYLVFVQDSAGKVGTPKPLLYAYNANICDSLGFCQRYPDYCASSVALCKLYPAFCRQIGEDFLFIGTWYAKAPTVEKGSTDMLVFTINKKAETVKVTDILPEYLTIEYFGREAAIENYKYLPSIDQQ